MKYKTNLSELYVGQKVFHTLTFLVAIILEKPKNDELRRGIKVLDENNVEDFWYENVAPYTSNIVKNALNELEK